MCIAFVVILFQQLEHNHAIIRLNGTVEQQNKAIDFLQSKIEEIEPKKKKVSLKICIGLRVIICCKLEFKLIFLTFAF